ncbi:MAG TPA: uracil-DNA glycosylase [Bacteroidetes bacterium]|nr:uracil-DNA glycosylase [Bacteroidota bacterium]
MSPQIDESWKTALASEFQQPYFSNLRSFLVKEKKAGQTIFPPGKWIFNAFNSTPLDKVKVVIIGQDPYHGPGQAHGLCFSVQKGVATPPSLKNMYKELNTDLGLPIPDHGNLQHWADQGVLLLNAILTVRAHQAASHRNQGWENFTDAAIRALNQERKDLVFLLWGGFAKKKASMIDPQKHHILAAAHPSPLSAYNGFYGCKHFSKTNEFLVAKGFEPIDWKV